MSTHRCPALFITAPASGQGKTTVTAALARWHRGQGRKVHVFKTGPDFLDPMILERASGEPVYQLDLWMGGENHCRALLHDAAAKAELILIEGVMGLFDGNPSSADLAALFGIPILAVIDASAMAQTFGAIAHGLIHYRNGLDFAGVLANRVGGATHADMLAESMSPDIHWFGALPHNPDLSLPDRHLGLVQAGEIADLESRLDCAARQIDNTKLTTLPPAVNFKSASYDMPAPMLKNLRIAVARDAAFSFLYRANLDCLQALGATLTFFSPLADQHLPETDAIYLPGGYPELHLPQLAENQSMKTALAAHHAASKPMVAECGGMMVLLQSLTSTDGKSFAMTGLLAGHAVMQSSLANLGLHHAQLPEGRLRGHTFHYSQMRDGPAQITQSEATRHSGKAESVFQQKRLTASYLHWYFPSNPTATARLFLA